MRSRIKAIQPANNPPPVIVIINSASLRSQTDPCASITSLIPPCSIITDNAIAAPMRNHQRNTLTVNGTEILTPPDCGRMSDTEWPLQYARPQSYPTRLNRRWSAPRAKCVRAPAPKVAAWSWPVRASPKHADRAHNTVLPGAASTGHSYRSRRFATAGAGGREPPRRARIAAAPSADGSSARSSRTGTGGTSKWISSRSSKGPESFAR